MKKLILGIALVTILIATMLIAFPVFAVPMMGCHYYGNVENGVPGDTISVKIRGIEYATTTIDLDGKYGQHMSFDVPSDDYGTRRVREGGRTGDKVEFYIGTQLVGVSTFEIWGLINTDLIYEEPEEPEVVFVNLQLTISIPSNEVVNFVDSIPYEVLGFEVE